LFIEVPGTVVVQLEAAKALHLKLDNPKVVQSVAGQVYIQADLYPQIRSRTGMAYDHESEDFIRNSTQTVIYTPSACYLMGDPNEQIYKHFSESGQLPAGTYTVGAKALFDLLDDAKKILGKYNIPLKEIEITVK
jgi:hypothetical protein